MAKPPKKPIDDRLQGSEIMRAIEKYKRESRRETKEITSLQDRLNERSAALGEMPDYDDISQSSAYTSKQKIEMIKLRSKLEHERDNLDERIYRAELEREKLLGSQLSTSVRGKLDPTIARREVGGRALSYDMISEARSRAQDYSQGQLQKRLTGLGSALGRVSGRMEEILGREEVTPEDVAQLERLERTRTGLIGKMAGSKAGLAAKKRLGQMDVDYYSQAERVLGKATGTIQAHDIKLAVEKDQAGSYKDVQAQHKTYTENVQNILGSLKGLEAGGQSASVEYKELQGALQKHIDALNSTTDVLREMERQGKHIGSLWHSMTKWGDGMKMGGGALGGISAGIRSVAVSSELMQMDVRSGYAGLALERYQDMTAAGRGDSAAMLRVMANSHVRAESLGQSLKASEQIAQGIDIVSGTIAGIGDSMSAAGATALQTGGSRLAATGAGAATFLRHGGNIATQIAMAYKGSAGAVDIDAQRKSKALDTITQAAHAAQLDSYKRTYMAVGEGLRGVGRGYEGVSRELLDNMGSLGTTYGLTPEATSAALDEIRSGMGSKATRRSTAGLAMGQSEALYALQRSGMLYQTGVLESPTQYSSMLKQISNVGGDTKSLDSILKEAFVFGLDSSKNIQQLVSGISNVASNTAGRLGVDASGGAARMMAGTLAFGQQMGVDPNLRVQMASDTAARMNEMSQQNRLTLGSTIFMNELGRMGITDTEDIVGLANTQLSDVESVIALAEGGKEEEAKTALQMLGGGAGKSFMKNGKIALDQVKQLSRTMKGTGAIAAGAYFANKGQGFAETTEWMRTGAVPSQATQDSMRKILSPVLGNAGTAAMFGALPVIAAGPQSLDPVGDALRGTQGGVSATSARMSYGLAAGVTAKEAEASKETLTKLNTTLENIVDVFSNLSGTKDFVQGAEAPAKAAQEMTTHMKSFNDNLSTFNSSIKKAADAMERAANAMSGRGQSMSPTDYLRTLNRMPPGQPRSGY